jgi:uncharacterized membrane protein HdeD (DUF308 family)
MTTNTMSPADDATARTPDRTPAPAMGPLEGLLRREAGRWWWVPLVIGIGWFVIAWLVLRTDMTSFVAVGAMVGVAFLVAGADEVAAGGFSKGGWRVAHYVMAGLFAAGAVWAFARPVETFFALASVLGLILFLQGALAVVRGVALRAVSPFWWVELLSGLLLTSLALWVSLSDQVWTLAANSAFILVWVGFMAVFRGISSIVLAFSSLWFSRSADVDGVTRTAHRILR